jgi:hypothetical protein
VVRASGHICGRWRKELVQPSSISEIVTWSVKISHHKECRNVEMRKTPFGVGFRYRKLECRNTSPQRMMKCQNAEKKNTFWCRFQIPGVGVSKHFTTRNAEMRKTPFGVGFNTWSWSSKHFTTRNVEKPKCIFLEVHSVTARND